MEVATMSSHLFPVTRMAQCPPKNSPSATSSLSLRASLSSNFFSASLSGSVSSEFSGQILRPASVNPYLPSRGKRGGVAMVIPFSRGSAWEQPPPDLASYLYKNRIIYLGMTLLPSVTELLLAEFIYLQYEDDEKPMYLYINSTGTTNDVKKPGYESEALAIYDAMSFIRAPIYTLCVGNAWGEAALLLAAGAKGNRAALPSSSIMIRQPMGSFRGQATDIDIRRNEMKIVKAQMVKLYAKTTGKTTTQIEADIKRPKYLSPSEAVEYGIIDKVLYKEKGTKDGGVVSDLKKAQLL